MGEEIQTGSSEQSITCKWYDGLSSYEYGDISCTAFPKGIPIEILTGIDDHRLPFSGDKGITWEKEPDDVLDYLPRYETNRERHTRQIAQYIEDLKEIENNPACPKWGANLHQIIYGMPAGPPTFGYAMGGCVIIGDYPRAEWWCCKCNIATNDDEITLGDYYKVNGAVLDLAAIHCKARIPECFACPIRRGCSHGKGVGRAQVYDTGDCARSFITVVSRDQ